MGWQQRKFTMNGVRYNWKCYILMSATTLLGFMWNWIHGNGKNGKGNLNSGKLNFKLLGKPLIYITVGKNKVI